MTNNVYRFGGGSSPQKAWGPLPPGDYEFSVVECSEPYQKDNGNWVLRVKLSIQPDSRTVYDQVWSGTTRDGERRDGIGDFLTACARAPGPGDEPDWAKVVGARGKCRLKIETASVGTLAGKEVNRVHYYYRPKEIAQPKAGPTPPDDTEPDNIPW
jgi:hypothetical protein